MGARLHRKREFRFGKGGIGEPHLHLIDGYCLEALGSAQIILLLSILVERSFADDLRRWINFSEVHPLPEINDNRK